MKLRYVTIEDCGRLEGEDLTPLYSAVVKVCPGIAGEALWEKIRAKYNLGVSGDCADWVKQMNAAIDIWNLNNPSSCKDIASAFSV